MAASALGPERTSMPFKGFDSVYTFHIGPNHKKLTVPGYVLTKIPSINRLISVKTLIEDEPVSLEAYDPEAFATIMGLVRDGFDGFELPETARQLIKAYIVAYDLNLEAIQNFLIDEIMAFHDNLLVEPEDFKLLYAAKLTSDCKIHTILLHQMAHHFHDGLYRERTADGGSSLDLGYAIKMECLKKLDLVQLSYQITLLSLNGQCTLCQSICGFHDHVFTPKCMDPAVDGRSLLKTPATAAAHIEANARTPMFTFTANKSAHAGEMKFVSAADGRRSAEVSRAVMSKYLGPENDSSASDSYTKVAQWFGGSSKPEGNQLKSLTFAAERSQPVNITSAGKESEKQTSTMTSDSSEISFPNVLTPTTSTQSMEDSLLRNDLVSTPPQIMTCRGISVGRVSGQASKLSKAATSPPTTEKPSKKTLPAARASGNLPEISTQYVSLPYHPAHPRQPAPQGYDSTSRIPRPTSHSANKKTGDGKQVPGIHKSSLKASIQEDDQASDVDSEACSDKPERSKKSEKLRAISELSATYPPVVTLTEGMLPGKKDINDICNGARRLTEHLAGRDSLNTAEKFASMPASHSRAPRPPIAYDRNHQVPETLQNHLADRLALREATRSQFDRVSCVSPSSQAFDHIRQYIDAIGQSNPAVKVVKESEESKNSQTAKQEIVRQSQNATELDSDQEYEDQMAKLLDDYSKDLRI